MWRQVALPVILLGVSWLTVSGSTNFYLVWLDASYQRAFDENIASMQAASLVQREVWHLHAQAISRWESGYNWDERLTQFETATQAPLRVLEERAVTAEERSVAGAIPRLADQYRRELLATLGDQSGSGNGNYASADHQAQLYSIAAQISKNADRIRQINDALLRSSHERRSRISQAVLWARGLAITLLPALGIALGWWTANRLQHSVARIQVSLHDPFLAAPGDLGVVQVRGGNELTSIQKQIEIVVDRLRRTGDELQAARLEVLRSERLAAIGGLAAGVAHELRNPLTSVKLLLQHAASRGGDATVAAAKIGLILDEIERMETTIQGLLDFSRPAQPQRKPHDVRQTLERAMHLIQGRAEKQRVATDLQVGFSSLVVNADPQQLHQVFVNLLINAIEAMPEGGELTVSLHGSPENNSLVVRVRDTGEGIPPDLLPRLFEPFASAKERGTGLGLAVSRRIVQEHGGSISVRSSPEGGSIFEVTLPAVPSPEAAALAY
jgi:two-component system, NtrC family, sensor histidine kinase HydH